MSRVQTLLMPLCVHRPTARMPVLIFFVGQLERAGGFLQLLNQGLKLGLGEDRGNPIGF
jgi:hypothetical protein